MTFLSNELTIDITPKVKAKVMPCGSNFESIEKNLTVAIHLRGTFLLLEEKIHLSLTVKLKSSPNFYNPSVSIHIAISLP